MFTDPASLENISVNGAPWENYDEAGRLEDVGRCAISFEVPDLMTRVRLSSNLRYRKSFVGRGLKQSMTVGDPPIYLMKGDRLEPTLALRDVSDFESLVPPFEVTFWRNFDEGRVLHDSPLFSGPRLGSRHPRTRHIAYMVSWASYLFHTSCALVSNRIIHLHAQDRFFIQGRLFE
jgi:hypothetical protein